MLKIRNLKETVLSDHWTKLTAVSYEQQDAGGEWRTVKRETYHNRNGAAVLPYDEERKTVLFVKQFRAPVYLASGSMYVLEACAGHIEKDESADETMLREAKEELGYQIHNLELVFKGFTTPGFSTEQLWLYLARYRPQDHRFSGGGLANEGENLDIVEMAVEEAIKLNEKGQINDMKTALLINELRRRLKL